MTVPSWGCPSQYPEALWHSSFRSALAPPYHVLGYDLIIAVGLLRFGLDLPEAKVSALLAVGLNLPLPQSSISRLSTEFPVRWRMLCEERLPPLLSGHAPPPLQVDRTVVPGAPVTFRAREARTGATL
jgi:hypothetical protein